MQSLITALLPAAALAQTAYTWQQIKETFAATNPTLKAAQLNIDESRAAEIQAYVRPNPEFTLSTDGTQLTRYEGVDRPFVAGELGSIRRQVNSGIGRTYAWISAARDSSMLSCAGSERLLICCQVYAV